MSNWLRARHHAGTDVAVEPTHANLEDKLICSDAIPNEPGIEGDFFDGFDWWIDGFEWCVPVCNTAMTQILAKLVGVAGPATPTFEFLHSISELVKQVRRLGQNVAKIPPQQGFSVVDANI